MSVVNYCMGGRVYSSRRAHRLIPCSLRSEYAEPTVFGLLHFIAVRIKSGVPPPFSLPCSPCLRSPIAAKVILVTQRAFQHAIAV